MANDLKLLTIVGFPKCGTSSLMRAIADDERAKVLRDKGGALEMHWKVGEAVEAEAIANASTPVIAHKFTAHIYAPRIIAKLAAFENRRFVVCVRNPVSSLVSWFLMHREIAESGRAPEHFAFVERDFYLNCTIDEYFERFAAARLNYADRIETLAEHCGADRIVVVSQEVMAELGAPAIADKCIRFALGQTDLDVGSHECGTSPRHISSAEKSGIELSDELREMLSSEPVAIRATLARLGIQSIV